jgi:hypothetical protein
LVLNSDIRTILLEPVGASRLPWQQQSVCRICKAPIKKALAYQSHFLEGKAPHLESLGPDFFYVASYWIQPFQWGAAWCPCRMWDPPPSRADFHFRFLFEAASGVQYGELILSRMASIDSKLCRCRLQDSWDETGQWM